MVITDPLASPTGYPFKVVRYDGDDVGKPKRERLCDLGYLRTPYHREDGRIGYRCPAEPIDAYLQKGGALSETVGRLCVCNGLVATIGLAQVRDDGTEEPPLITSGDELKNIGVFLSGRASYSAADVIDYLMSGVAATYVEGELAASR